MARQVKKKVCVQFDRQAMLLVQATEGR